MYLYLGKLGELGKPAKRISENLKWTVWVDVSLTVQPDSKWYEI